MEESRFVVGSSVHNCLFPDDKSNVVTAADVISSVNYISKQLQFGAPSLHFLQLLNYLLKMSKNLHLSLDSR